MKKTLFLFLIAFIALSTIASAQSAQHEVQTTLTEIRQLTLTGGGITIPVKKSAAGNWTLNASCTLGIRHDLLLPQRITIHTIAAGVTAWTERFLRVSAVLPATGLGAGANTPGTITLVDNNTFPIQGSAAAVPFINSISATESAPGTPGQAPPVELHYEARAGIGAITNDTDVVTVVYTIEDQP